MEIEMNNEGDIQRLKVDQYGIDNLTFCLYLNQSHTTRTITYRKKFLYSFIKRLFDIVASIIALIILFIPMLIIGIGVKLTSKGPMIYVSTRIGKNGKKFRFYKFRSMRKDAEKELSQLLEKNEVKGGVTFKMENDPRVTKYGRFLRKTSLDELPQLFNILKGDMTFVGPRPCTDRDIFWSNGASKGPTLSRNTRNGGLEIHSTDRRLDHVTALLGKIFHIEHNVGLNAALLTCGMEH